MNKTIKQFVNKQLNEDLMGTALGTAIGGYLGHLRQKATAGDLAFPEAGSDSGVENWSQEDYEGMIKRGEV